MDQFSFHGPFAYRWIDDVPVERIDLRNGERCPIEMGASGIPPVTRREDSLSEAVVRAAMAAWN